MKKERWLGVGRESINKIINRDSRVLIIPSRGPKGTHLRGEYDATKKFNELPSERTAEAHEILSEMLLTDSVYRFYQLQNVNKSQQFKYTADTDFNIKNPLFRLKLDIKYGQIQKRFYHAHK